MRITTLPLLLALFWVVTLGKASHHWLQDSQAAYLQRPMYGDQRQNEKAQRTATLAPESQPRQAQCH